MSGIQAWQKDVDAAETAAFLATTLPTRRERMAAVTVAFRQCGEASLRYPDPVTVRQMLVAIISRTFSQELAERRAVKGNG